MINHKVLTSVYSVPYSASYYSIRNHIFRLSNRSAVSTAAARARLIRPHLGLPASYPVQIKQTLVLQK